MNNANMSQGITGIRPFPYGLNTSALSRANTRQGLSSLTGMISVASLTGSQVDALKTLIHFYLSPHSKSGEAPFTIERTNQVAVFLQSLSLGLFPCLEKAIPERCAKLTHYLRSLTASRALDDLKKLQAKYSEVAFFIDVNSHEYGVQECQLYKDKFEQQGEDLSARVARREKLRVTPEFLAQLAPRVANLHRDRITLYNQIRKILDRLLPLFDDLSALHEAATAELLAEIQTRKAK